MRIYLDHAATTPLSAAAAKAMKPWINDRFGNPSSLHAEGLQAKKAIDEAREVLSSAAECLFGEFIFTSGGTEAATLAIVGAAINAPPNRRRILLSAADHHCVIHTRPVLERLGMDVVILPVDRDARVDLDYLSAKLDDSVLLVAAMHANNELGTFNDVEAIGDLCRAQGVLFFCDAVQTFPVTMSSVNADLMSMSAHKLGGPKGVGGLVVRSGLSISPIIAGGGQEREMRGGTENVAGIVGFAAAVRDRLADDQINARKSASRDEFLTGLSTGSIPFQTTATSATLPGHLHIRFPGINADSTLIRLDRQGVAASSGAACSSGSIEPSHVLQACGYTESEAQEGLRFTFGGDISPSTAREAGQITARVAEEIAALNQPL